MITDLEKIESRKRHFRESITSGFFHVDVMIPADLIRMSDLSQIMIRSALESYVTKNEETAAQVVHMDDKVDII